MHRNAGKMFYQIIFINCRGILSKDFNGSHDFPILFHGKDVNQYGDTVTILMPYKDTGLTLSAVYDGSEQGTADNAQRPAVLIDMIKYVILTLPAVISSAL